LCAAIELNAHPDPALAAKVNRPFGVDQFWLKAIYNISGGGGDGYSMPSGVIAAARQLGMNAQVIAAATKSVSLLEQHYPHEMAKIVNDLVRVSNKHLGDVALIPNERAMHCVRIGDVTPAVHWVLQRNDNSYMDPAGGASPMDIIQGGATVQDRTTLKATGQRTFLANSYHGTGLAVILSV
jgi:hypothetical protein